MKDLVEKRFRHMLMALRSFISIFLLICFVVTCCTVIFLEAMQKAMNIELQRADIQYAAKITFGNVILLSLLCAVIDALRRKIMVGRPVKRIVRASERVMRGDLLVRIKKSPASTQPMVLTQL